MGEIARNLTRYQIELGDENQVPVGRTEPIDIDFKGVVPMPAALHGKVVCFYRAINISSGVEGDWVRFDSSIPGEGGLAENVRMTVGDT